MRLTAARLSKVLQLTLAVIKPDAVAHPLVSEALHQRILDNNFVIVRHKDLVWRTQDSERFYAEHSGRFFYQRLVEFMASGPMRAYILAREDGIRHWRELMGPTKVFRARYTSPPPSGASLDSQTHGTQLTAQILLNRHKEKSDSSSRTSVWTSGWRKRSRRSDLDSYTSIIKNRSTQFQHKADPRSAGHQHTGQRTQR